MKNSAYLIKHFPPLQILTHHKARIFKDCGIKLQWIKAVSLIKAV